LIEISPNASLWLSTDLLHDEFEFDVSDDEVFEKVSSEE
jgi:hypothetical protein